MIDLSDSVTGHYLYFTDLGGNKKLIKITTIDKIFIIKRIEIESMRKTMYADP